VKSLKKEENFEIGSLKLKHNIICAPLAGCSDFSFRKMIRNFSKESLLFCEMVKMEALIHENVKTYKYLQFEKGMHPIGAQICGTKPKLAKICAKIVEDSGFDIIDLNCGCPVKKVVKDGSGSALLNSIDLIGELIEAMVSVVNIPVTIKIRLGWDESSIVAKDVVKIAKQAGAAAVFIHGRTRSQAYKGDINYSLIKECVEIANDEIKIIGNGNIFDVESAKKMIDETSCHGILLARGLFGQPWLVSDIYDHVSGKNVNRSFMDTKNALIKHFEIIRNSENEIKALLDMRRVGCWYLKGIEGSKALRMAINKASSLKEIFNLIHSFNNN
jgi:tRNA-dihydrouridine synthase B